MFMRAMKGYYFVQVLVFFLLCVFCGLASSKECTNTPTELSSHTFRYNLLSSNNKTLKALMFANYHLTPTDDSVWPELNPKRMLTDADELDWKMLYGNVKRPVGDKAGFLKEISLSNVRLSPGSMHWQAQQTNLEYLLMLDVDRLAWSFRKTAGLETPGSPYGGWEDPNCELRGHFVGHYLSATAQMWASTRNQTLGQKMTTLVSALSDCQKKIGSGYLSAFPSKLFDRLEAIKPVWAPYYTIHKILAGLLDQYTFALNVDALRITKWMVDYFYKRVQNVIAQYSIERHYLSLNEESGGMNDVLYRLYTITRNESHLTLAHLFDKPCFLGLLALQVDELSGFHANTHIPVVVGSQMRYEITGDSIYKDIGIFFLDIINSSHSYATGGTSVREFWKDPRRLATTLETENEESCATYNMLKVSRNLFRWTKEIAYADYYERALTNGVIGIQRGIEPGVMIYMLPLRNGSSKARSAHGWGNYNASFWCCYGTGIESFSKLGDSIYFEEQQNVPELYIIQYISSSINWHSGMMVVNQTVDNIVSSDPFLRVLFAFAPKKDMGISSTLKLRIPVWTHTDGATAVLNTQKLNISPPGNFLSITEQWTRNHILSLQLPIDLRTEAIKDDRPQYAAVQAILYGPYLLAGYSNGAWNITPASTNSLSDWIIPVPAEYYNHQLVSFTQQFDGSDFALTNTNQSITIQKFPKQGTDDAVHATFRLIFNASSSPTNHTLSYKDAINKTIMLEPFDVPGTRLFHRKNNSLILAAYSSDNVASLFTLVPGLDGKDGTISLESVTNKGCFVFSGVNASSGSVLRLNCNAAKSDASFNEGASFVMRNGLSNYHPISFVANGVNRNFLLVPLLSFRDESYTVYFGINKYQVS